MTALKRYLLCASILLATQCAALAELDPEDEIWVGVTTDVAQGFASRCDDLVVDDIRVEELQASEDVLTVHEVHLFDKVAEYLPESWETQSQPESLSKRACDAAYKAFGPKGTVVSGLLKRV